MLLRVFGKNLKNDDARHKAVEQAIAQARELYASKPMEEAREPLLKLRDQLEQQGIETLELLRASEAALSGDHFWLREIVAILLRRRELAEAELGFVLRLAILEPERIDLWQRLLRTARESNLIEFEVRVREQASVALLPYFPAPGRDNWRDRITRDDAMRIFRTALRDTARLYISIERKGQQTLDILQAALIWYPEESEFRRALAMHFASMPNDGNPMKLRVVLETLMEEPRNMPLRLWTASALLQAPGHEEEGLEIIRQAFRDAPLDLEVRDAYAEALRSRDALSADDFAFLSVWFEDHPEDQRILEVLADDCARREDLGEEARELYRRAAAVSARRAVYLRLLGRASATHGDWEEVIHSLEGVGDIAHESVDIVIPLATAYAEYDKSDEKALLAYKRAIELGSRKAEIHNLYCRHLYLRHRESPDSVAQFLQTLQVCPDCSWAHLGMIQHYLSTHDPVRALDNAVGLLTRQPNDVEALRLAAAALAEDYSRKQLARISHLPPRIIRALFEEAHRVAPDASPILMGLARQRLGEGVCDADTARLLGDVLRHYPEASDLRLSRADMLWELNDRDNAVELYRDLLDRTRSRPGSPSSRMMTTEVRRRILFRTAESLLRPAGPAPADLDVVIEAATEPDASPEILVGAARALVETQTEHEARRSILERALPFAGTDVRLGRAAAEALAVNGDPRHLCRLVLQAFDDGDDDEETSRLVRNLRAVATSTKLPEDFINRLRFLLDPDRHSPAGMLAATEILALASPVEPSDLPILRRLSECFPRNLRVRRRLGQCLALLGQEEEVARIYAEIEDAAHEDDELVLDMARANARLGRHSPQHLRLAQRALELAPNDLELQFHLASIELAMGMTTRSARRLDHLLEQVPQSHGRIQTLLERHSHITTEQGDLLLLLARLHIRAGRIEQALGTLTRLLQSGYQHYFSELMSCYTDLIRIAPDNPRAHVERGILHRLAGHLDEAIEDLERGHSLAPDNADLLSELADLLRQKLESGPENLDLALRLAFIFLELNDDFQAFEMVDYVIRHDPLHNQALQLQARLQLNAGSLKNCWQTLKSISDKETVLGLLQELARACADRGDHVMAAQVLADAVEAAGTQRELLEQLRHLYHEQARALEGAAQRDAIMTSLSTKARQRYELREQIGSGAMGVVYKAYDRELDEIVVLKILPEYFTRDADAVARFRNEAKAARKLAHPNICRIHDIGEEGGRKHISMEYVAGGDLRGYLSRHGGRLARVEALRVIRETAQALAHAHDEGVLHRDIKSANIMLTSTGRVKLSDFGIAAMNEVVSPSNPQNSSTVAVGTPLYMAPEQFDGQVVSPASDLYSLGVLFYEILSGSLPFVRGSISYHHRFTPPPRPEVIPDDLWAIIKRLMEKDPARRYQRAADLIRDLDALGAGIMADSPTGAP